MNSKIPGILKFVIGVSLRDMKRDSDAEHYRLVSESVKVGEIFTIFKVFPFLLPSSFFLLPSSLPSLYKTDATGHDINRCF